MPKAKQDWKQMTTVQFVVKKSGKKKDFSKEKLYTSILNAVKEGGLKDSEWHADRLTGHTITRINKAYRKDIIPTTTDISEITSVTMIDNNLAFIARKYMGKNQELLKNTETEEKYGNGITVERYFTKEGVHPYDELEWEYRTASIKDQSGNIIFEQTNVEVPKTWSQTATNIVVSKYFTGKVGEEGRENSIRQLVDRVAKTMTIWGKRGGYFQTEQDADIFEAELTHILINQKAAFNSPVWFNVGVHEHPQVSACFINSVEDDMRSIMNLATTESMLFKYGSGAGANLSKLRGSCEYLSRSNGKSSGVVSFMKGWDAFAGIVKSGGKTRRAAKMVMLDIDHPDILEFIQCKMKEEKKAWALIDAGYDGSFTGEAYSSIFFQNANNSVRVSDAFMKAVEAGEDWKTTERTTGNTADEYKAAELMDKIAESAWFCGDPGIQYDTTINEWHTAKNSDKIYGSNPCSEYMFLNDTSCNLSSLNLMNFRKGENQKEFDVEAYKSAITIMLTAMEISVGNASYPTPAIEQNSYDYRPLGIGYANLGALLMSRGLAYDSTEGRNLAAAITSLLTGQAYLQSTKIAATKGAFQFFEKNKEPFLEVMQKHQSASQEVSSAGVPEDLQTAQKEVWKQVEESGKKNGFRNAQISVLAPTGTISFLMDCATTGIEPDIALVKYKWMVDGGMEKLVNDTVPDALSNLGYSKEEETEIFEYIIEKDTIEGAPHLKEEHLPIFDCAFKAANGTRTIHYMGHIRMMAAVQPFLSGAISKTVNMPENSTKEDIKAVYMEGWKLGLKAIAIYRDGSKRLQALTTSLDKDKKEGTLKDAEKEVEIQIKEVIKEVNIPKRYRLPDERRSITHKFSIGGHTGYITVGIYNDGKPGELFIMMSKEGSVISGLMNALASAVSIALQYGVPLEALVNRFAHMRFEPAGFTNNPNIKIAKSIVDYIFRYMALKFLETDVQIKLGINIENQKDNIGILEVEKKLDIIEGTKKTEDTQQTLFESKKEEGKEISVGESHTQTFDNQSDAPACETCGSIMVRNAACYKCLNCGATSGCS